MVIRSVVVYIGAGVGKNITYRVQGSLGDQRGKCTVKMRATVFELIIFRSK